MIIQISDTVLSPPAVAEKFNEYFSDIADNLKQTNTTSTGQQNPDSDIDYRQDSSENTIYLRLTDPGGIHNIKKFKNKTSLDNEISALKIIYGQYILVTS
jgi:hypothetical protein